MMSVNTSGQEKCWGLGVSKEGIEVEENGRGSTAEENVMACRTRESRSTRFERGLPSSSCRRTTSRPDVLIERNEQRYFVCMWREASEVKPNRGTQAAWTRKIVSKAFVSYQSLEKQRR